MSMTIVLNMNVICDFDLFSVSGWLTVKDLPTLKAGFRHG